MNDFLKNAAGRFRERLAASVDTMEDIMKRKIQKSKRVSSLENVSLQVQKLQKSLEDFLKEFENDFVNLDERHREADEEYQLLLLDLGSATARLKESSENINKYLREWQEQMCSEKGYIASAVEEADAIISRLEEKVGLMDVKTAELLRKVEEIEKK